MNTIKKLYYGITGWMIVKLAGDRTIILNADIIDGGPFVSRPYSIVNGTGVYGSALQFFVREIRDGLS